MLSHVPPATYTDVTFNRRKPKKPSHPKPDSESKDFVPTETETATPTERKDDSKRDSPPQSEPQPEGRRYYQRLIPRRYIPMDEIDENFNKEEWMIKLYGEGVRFIDIDDEIIPSGWVLIEGKSLIVSPQLIARS